MAEPTDPNSPSTNNAAQHRDSHPPAAPPGPGSGAASPVAADALKSDPEFAPVTGAETAGEVAPHKPRDVPRHRAKCKVECRKGAAGSSSNIGEGLLDLSEKGAKVIVKEAVDAGRTVELRMFPRGEIKPIVVLGKVVRCEALGNGSFSLGVKFDKHIQFSDLRRLT